MEGFTSESHTQESHTQVVPPCDTVGFFHDFAGQMASNPTSLADPAYLIDDQAVFSILQFGAIIPPLSPWRGVARLMPGYKYLGRELVNPVTLSQEEYLSKLDAEQQADEIEILLDRVLRKQIGSQEDPVLLFSGGVDSGLIASRLASLGHRETLLLNFSFSDDDEESKLAEAMARRLGLRYERVSAERSQCSCLERPGEIYPQPFADHSTVPTSELAHATVRRLLGRNRLILDGTGADGAFGMASKIARWERVTRQHMAIRKTASMLYKELLWQRESRFEHAWPDSAALIRYGATFGGTRTESISRCSIHQHLG